MPVDEKTVVFPGDALPKFEPAGTMTTTDFVDHVIHINNHLGTHIDAPAHMVEGGKWLRDYSAEKFVCEGTCIDARGKELTANLLEDIDVKPGQAVLFYTGRGDNFKTQAYAEDYAKFGQDLADLLVAKQVSMVGVDMISYDHDAPFPIHKTLLEADILLIENLINLGEVASKVFKLYALPLKLDLEAAPARVIAEVEA